MIVETPATHWEVAPEAPAARIAAYADTTPVAARLLHARKIAPDEASRFLSDRGQPLADPLLLSGMKEAVARIRLAYERSEAICIYGDYDADGMTAQALLVSALRAWGFPDVRPYTPHRENEGYGLHHEALEEIARDGANLVIAVDCGISNAVEVARIRERGVDVIVVDHHTISAALPDAAAVINPHMPTSRYPFRDLAGVGVAYALVRALAQSGPPLRRPEAALLNTLLALVAIGTVADVVPLMGENRVLVQAGLRALRKTDHLGLRALCERAGIPLGTLEASHIAFAIAPRLNAPGRMGSTENAYRLLLPESEREARMAAVALDEANRERQGATQQAVAEAIAMIESGTIPGTDRLLFLGHEDWNIGIVGLVAARLVEKYHRPALVYNRDKTESRGSARSIAAFNIIEALNAHAPLMAHHGGHPRAAGFAVANANLAALHDALLERAAALTDEDLAPTLQLDGQIAHHEVSLITCAEVSALAPFGHGNAEPVFLVPAVRVREARRVGAEGAHLAFQVKLTTGANVRCIAFSLGPRERDVLRWGTVDLAATLQRDVWQGDERLQLRIKDIRPATL